MILHIGFGPTGIMMGKQKDEILLLIIKYKEKVNKISIKFMEQQWIINNDLLTEYYFTLVNPPTNDLDFIIGFSTYLSFILLLHQSLFLDILPFTIQSPCDINEVDGADAHMIQYFIPIYKGLMESLKSHHWLHHYAALLLSFSKKYKTVFRNGPVLSESYYQSQQSLIESSKASQEDISITNTSVVDSNEFELIFVPNAYQPIQELVFGKSIN